VEGCSAGRVQGPLAPFADGFTVERNGICGAKRRGKPWRTTRPDPAARRRPDLVDRDFTAAGPNELSVADITYLRCWEGVVFFAFIIDAYSRRIVGWQLAGHMRTTLVLDALRMALHQRGGGADVELVHHSDRGSPNTPRSTTPRPWPTMGSWPPSGRSATATTRRWLHSAPPGRGWMGSRRSRRRPCCLASRGSAGFGGS